MSEKEFDAIEFKRKLSKQFSENYSNKEGLIDWKKLNKDIEEDKKGNSNNE